MRTTPWIKLCKGAVLALAISFGLAYCHTSGTFDTAKTEQFRPVYHHTPLYGRMDNVNGLACKNGEYHLYFQYIPYDSGQENQYEGHSISKDLIHWEYLVPTTARDTLKHLIFNDSENFRNPKVFWYAPENKWIMIVSTDKEIDFYDSTNEKDWNYISSFGAGYGVQPCLFEYPDMVELPVDGNTNHKKWALIVNVDPGCYFGGSATQYFIGDFNGTKFICDNLPNVTKWLDWGKDHYATLCSSNTGERVIIMPWMNNRQYYNIVPAEQFRSTNALPRELGLYTLNGDIYLSVTPVTETRVLRKETKKIPAFSVTKDYHIHSLLSENEGAYELSLDIVTGKAEIMGFSLFNDKGEKVDIYFNLPEKKLVMDRTKSGITDFGKNSSLHKVEVHDRRKTTAINYIDDFALATWAPIQKDDRYKLDIFVDKCSIEIFLNDGKIAMTNLVFPTEPYNRMYFYGKGGTFNVDSFNVYRLGL